MMNNRVIMIRRTACIAMAVVCAIAAGYEAAADSLWNAEAEAAGSLFSDKRVRYNIGDVIMVMVSETTSAETTASTDTEKESELSASSTAPTLVDATGMNAFKEGLLPNWSLNGESSFEADGTTRRENTLTTVVSVQVMEIMPSGNLRIEGTKLITVNRERTSIHVKGILRPGDVTARNTVLSSQLASGEIIIEGNGPLWNMQRRGFITKLLDWIWPF